MRDTCIKPFSHNPAAKSAAHLFHHNEQGITIHDTFLFAPDLESVGKWYRQLTAESLGKDGQGITPTVSIGSTDLHSMVQLYLGGPNDKVTTFVTVDNPRHKLHVPELDMGFEDRAQAEGYTYNELLDAIYHGTATAYEHRNRPYLHVELPDTGAHTIGQFLQFKMMEIIYYGRLLGVNAFNQPNVEEYKEETRKLLTS
jgi:glucose-6-phosphate isomerase